MISRVDSSQLLEFLLLHGWDYKRLPASLRVVHPRQLQRIRNLMTLPTHATNTDHVRMALLEVDPPRSAKAQKRRRYFPTGGVPEA